jgi:hypothetical protein
MKSRNNSTSLSKQQKRGRSSDSPVKTGISPELKKMTGITLADLQTLRSEIKEDTIEVVQPLKNQISQLEIRLERIEKNFKENNIIIHGLKDDGQERKIQLLTKLREVVLGPIGFKNVGVDNVYRLGPPINGKCRPIIVRLVCVVDKEPILQASRHDVLKKEKIFINSDLTEMERNKRDKLRQHLEQVKKSQPEITGSVRGNSLFIKKDGAVVQRLKIINGKIVGAGPRILSTSGGSSPAFLSADEEMSGSGH